MTAPRPPLKGRKLGDRRVVVQRPHSDFFRYSGPGTMVAKAAASTPRTAVGRRLARVRSFFFGKPLANAEEIDERLSKKLALPIFSSDAISSSAYATDEILKVLILAGAAALTLSLWIAAGIALLLAIVAFSYRQVCRAYPSGGGAYVVARENLGPSFGVIAAAALMVDYVMTVAVSTASAIANLASAIPAINEYRVELAALSVVLVTAANLRGLRESGNIFALPTYVFLFSALLAIVVGIANSMMGSAHAVPADPVNGLAPGTEMVGLFLLLHAFAGGSVALTGVEAIANGVPAFKPPEAKNAANHAGHDGPAARRHLHRAHIRGRAVRRPSEQRERRHGARADRRSRLRRTVQAALLRAPGQRRSDPVPGREHELQRVPAPRGDPGRRTATFPGSSRSAETGWRSRGASSSWRPWPS